MSSPTLGSVLTNLRKDRDQKQRELAKLEAAIEAIETLENGGPPPASMTNGRGRQPGRQPELALDGAPSANFTPTGRLSRSQIEEMGEEIVRLLRSRQEQGAVRLSWLAAQLETKYKSPGRDEQGWRVCLSRILSDLVAEKRIRRIHAGSFSVLRRSPGVRAGS